jgi:type IV secretory pathway TraG/TraD family ATPase VirD4
MKKKILLILFAVFLAWNFGPLFVDVLGASGPLAGAMWRLLLPSNLTGLDPTFYFKFILAIVLFYLLLQGLGVSYSFVLPKMGDYGETKLLRRVQGWIAELTIILAFFLLLSLAASLALNGWQETHNVYLYAKTLKTGWPYFLLLALALWVKTHRYIKQGLVSLHKILVLDFIEIGRFGKGGSARFAGLIEEWGKRYEAMKPGKMPPLFLGRSLYGRGLHLGSHDDRMMTTFGGTRGYKGIAAIIPNVLKWAGSVFVIDPKGTIALVTARHRIELGQEVYVFDPFNVLAQELAKIGKTFRQVFGKEKGDTYDPLTSLDLNSETLREDIEVIADAYVVPEPNRKDNHWDESAKELLGGKITQLITPFRRDHLIEPERFLNKLYAQKDLCSTWLYNQAENTRHLITARQAAQKEAFILELDEELELALLLDFNRILTGPCWHEEERFAQVRLGEDTRDLLAQKPTDRDLIHLNRLLLLDAYREEFAQQRQKPSLPLLRELLTITDSKAQIRLLDAMRLNPLAGGLARDAASRMIQGLGTDEIANIRSNANKHTRWMGSEPMRRILTSEPLQRDLRQGKPSFTFQRPKKKPCTVYLILPPRLLDIHSRWLRLFVNNLLKEIPQGGRSPIPILLMLDEFQQLGTLPEMVRTYRLLAGYNCCAWIFAQDWPGMLRLYGEEAKTFIANSRAVQVFSLVDSDSLELISKQIGNRALPQLTGMNTLRTTRLRGSDEAGKETARDSNKQYILVAGQAPLVCERVKYFEDQESRLLKWLAPSAAAAAQERIWVSPRAEQKTKPKRNWQERLLERYFPFYGLYDPDPDYAAQTKEIAAPTA